MVRNWPIAVIPRGVRLQASNPQLLGRRGLFDNLVGAKQDRWGYRKAKRLGGLKVYDHLEFCRQLHREIARLGAAQDAIHIGGGTTKVVCLGGAVGEQTAFSDSR